ncbi:MAG: rod shape-determining protein MreC [Burkholderiales bacterium]|jgi:rod shape-determining protein MreC|nr:rod shape-determining protein MreC [Burkholderiales bacterium]
MYPGEPLPSLYRGPSVLARFVFFALLALTLIFVDSRYHYLETARNSITTALFPLQSVARLPSWAYREVSVYFRNKAVLSEENENVRRQLLEYEHTEQMIKSVSQENEQLRALLGIREAARRQVLSAEIFHDVRDPFVQKIAINKGERHGVREGAAVLDARGVAGQVTRVFPWTAEVTLIVEKEFITPVQNQRSGERNVLYGMGAGQPMELRFVTPDSNIRVGDKLVTSGLENIYPEGLLVAIVSAIENNPEASFLYVTATPVADIGNSRYLLVVEPHQPLPLSEKDEGKS